jgi:hypothetical protein
MLTTIHEAAVRMREVVIDTGCRWPEAALKTLDEVELSTEDITRLAASGLAIYGQKHLNRMGHGNGKDQGNKTPTVEELLEPFGEFVALTRVFRIGDTNKRLIDADRTELPLVIDYLKAKRDGFTQSIKFILDLQAECERQKCDPRDLPKTTLRKLDGVAPW